MTTPTVDVQAEASVRGILEAVYDDKIVISLPHTEYRLHVVPTVTSAAITTPVGKRIKGTIHARALRIFKAAGGGQFIEPLDGAPRIVAGRVVQIDTANRRIIVDMAAPVWMSLAEDNELSDEERRAVLDRDVTALYRLGVHGLILRPFTILHQMPEPDYLEAIRR